MKRRYIWNPTKWNSKKPITPSIPRTRPTAPRNSKRGCFRLYLRGVGSFGPKGLKSPCRNKNLFLKKPRFHWFLNEIWIFLNKIYKIWFLLLVYANYFLILTSNYLDEKVLQIVVGYLLLSVVAVGKDVTLLVAFNYLSAWWIDCKISFSPRLRWDSQELIHEKVFK